MVTRRGQAAPRPRTGHPPGVPAILPGERSAGAVVDYLRSGLAAGMKLPDAADPELRTFRVVTRD